MKEATAKAIVEKVNSFGIRKVNRDNASVVIGAWLRALGWKEDRWGNYLNPQDDGERYHFKTNVLNRQKKSSGDWSNMSSTPLIDAASNLIVAAAAATGDEDLAKRFSKAKVKRKEEKAARADRAEDERAGKEAYELTMKQAGREDPSLAVLYVTRKASETKRNAFEEKYRPVVASWKQAVLEDKRPETDEQFADIDHPPVMSLYMSFEYTYDVEVDGVAYSVHASPTESGHVDVEIGRPSSTAGFMRISATSQSMKFTGNLDAKGDAYISGRLFEVDGKRGAVLFLIASHEKRTGAGSRVLEIWCRMMKGLGIKTWIAEAVGDEGAAFFTAMARKKKLEVYGARGSNWAISCKDKSVEVKENPTRKAKKAQSAYQYALEFWQTREHEWQFPYIRIFRDRLTDKFYLETGEGKLLSDGPFEFAGQAEKHRSAAGDRAMKAFARKARPNPVKDVDDALWTIQRKFGVAGGPDELVLTQEGMDRAWSVGAQVKQGRASKALELLWTMGGEGVKQKFYGYGNKSQLTQLGEFSEIVWGELRALGYVESFDREGVRLTEAGRRACKNGIQQREYLLRRCRENYTADPRPAPTITRAQAEETGSALGVRWDKVPFDVEQFQRGMQVELEHGDRDDVTNLTDDGLVATGMIVLAHLREVADYYYRLDEMERSAKREAKAPKSKPSVSMRASIHDGRGGFKVHGTDESGKDFTIFVEDEAKATAIRDEYKNARPGYKFRVDEIMRQLKPTAQPSLEERTLRRTGTAYRGKVSVKIVQHMSGEGYGVETTVAGDRRLPTEKPMTLEQAQRFALEQLDSPRDAAKVNPTSSTDSKRPCVGFTWKSPRGERSVFGIQVDPSSGKQVYLIASEGSRSLELVPADEIERYVFVEESNYKSRKQARQQTIQAEQKQTTHDSWSGFVDALTPTKKAKAIDALNKQVSVRGEFAARGDHIAHLVANGWRVQKTKTGRVLEAPGGTFLSERDLTKTALDFAEYLSKGSPRSTKG